MSPLQEKNQVVLSGRNEGGESFTDFSSARDTRDQAAFLADNGSDVDMRRFNQMPPGMEISSQIDREIKPMPFVIASQSDVSRDTSTGAFLNGFTPRTLKDKDCMTPGVDVDLFCDDAGGFIDRHDYIKRV